MSQNEGDNNGGDETGSSGDDSNPFGGDDNASTDEVNDLCSEWNITSITVLSTKYWIGDYGKILNYFSIKESHTLTRWLKKGYSYYNSQAFIADYYDEE